MKLLETTQLGNLALKNRMVMSAMTRSRADSHGIVGQMTAEYYTQRASAGLIITEAIRISEEATGSPFTPGIYTDEQIRSWKKVTQAVHERGGLIVAQLWHTGRAGHSIDRGGKLPLAPSPLAIQGMQHFTSQGQKEYETPREITIEEIRRTILDYGQAARNAMEAGFDGVELHAANGYLPNQFLAESANQRTDEYGGSIPNKSRFVLEVMQELLAAVGGDRVGIKLSPFHPYGNMVLDQPVETYQYLIEELNKLDFAYVELMKRNPYFPSPSHYPAVDEVALIGRQIRQTVIANTGYEKASAETELGKGIAQLISFGTLFLANPDLPARFELGAGLNEPDRATMVGGGAQGYTDYPFLEDMEALPSNY
ncbi:N-ethylmaleimide reductase [Dyadobacter sp. BE34]|uniref:N-ethylmaleimide reductase n=1 Tax=Dyadobacter fermentans TaxID=94254 RepID=A0ABU1QY49_9BACT|nr:MULTISPECIES: alkene reductase [Dyadobacter]MDR6806018.1 N-ethylmaleimide reductase [Dyadobacter fermentans]MDR7043759.1 N-ethylmaleimide reductase [Dyadobacter sp. BE242]MDR7198071.1 N-ethylmaleimide reductase [Dyadobacter sp. BE34]MDR7216033.1 N-ethylmaleimide reductase [Dyadobacter sp. BE31]MDR7264441.1 N-ethylmaleimide reductase [Dyadobacter sp. BE32]